MKLSFTYSHFKKIVLLFGTLLYSFETLQAQCPADPVNCIPSTTVSTMPDTAFICEGVTSLLLSPNIPGGNFTWFREDKNSLGIYNPAGNSSSLANITVEAYYYVCHQQSNASCYIRDKVLVAKKSLATQLANEKEFDTPAPLFICSGQSKPFFNSAGNTAKYSYSWQPTSLFVGPANIKNAKFSATYPKGASSVGQFAPHLTISEKYSNCSIRQTFKPIVYPTPNPDFGNLQFCQNQSETITMRVFVVKNYSIRNATLNIGNAAINLFKSDFTKIPSSQLIPNTLGEVTPPNKIGRQLNNPIFLIDVAKIPINTTQLSSSTPITFTMVTDSGCSASISSSYSVGNVYPAPTITQEIGKLKSNLEYGNKWYINGQPMKDSTNQFLTPIANGTYTAKYINGECTSSMSLPYDFVLGSEDGFIANNSLQIFPNPTNNILHIQVPFAMEKIVVYQSNGKLALETKASETIDVTSLSEGLYLLEVWNKEGKRVVKKFEKR